MTSLITCIHLLRQIHTIKTSVITVGILHWQILNKKKLLEMFEGTFKGGVTRATKLLQLATKSDFYAC